MTRITSDLFIAGGAEAASASDGDTPDKNKKPKRNRCHTCKKKVGLTGTAPI